MHALISDLLNIHIVHSVTIKVQFHNYTFLPYEHHLEGSVSQPESQNETQK